MFVQRFLITYSVIFGHFMDYFVCGFAFSLFTSCTYFWLDFFRCGLLMNRNQKTFRPKKNAPSGNKVIGISNFQMITSSVFIILLFGGLPFYYFFSTNTMWKGWKHFFFLVVDMFDQGVQLKKHIDATLGSGNLRDAVRLPPGEDLNEWLAVNSKLYINFYVLTNKCINLRKICTM